MNIRATELRERIEKGEALQLIDVRSPGEYAAGHIPFAVNMPLEQVDARLEDLKPHTPVVLICQSGRRAEMCKENIRHHREDLILLEDGTQGWIEAGLPMVQCSASRWSIERQVRLTAGLLILVGTTLSLLVAPGWVYLAMFVGAGLTFAGLTNICGMASLFAVMPWNRPKAQEHARSRIVEQGS
jgi:rhodanese-related sulfurtransferase